MNEIKINSKNFKNSWAKAKANKRLVKMSKKDGQYFVNGSGENSSYVVQFQRGAGGKKLGGCSCPAGLKELGCYHLAAALFVHSGFVGCGLRQPAPFRSAIAENANQFYFRGDNEVRNLI